MLEVIIWKKEYNSFENIKRENLLLKGKNFDAKENEKDIQDCQIYISGKKINFTYDYENGTYKIKYKFKKLFNSTNFMFLNCNSLSSKNLSNFNTQNVTGIQYMFNCCKSLPSLNLNCNTRNVTNI